MTNGQRWASTVTRRTSATALAVLTSFTVATVAPAARADEVEPTPKGIVGGALLGAEVVTIGEALVGVRSELPYWIGAVVGAGGGGVGGYFIEKSSDDGRIPVYMLAGGLALALPAIVLTLNAVRYRPSEEAVENRAPTNALPADPGQTGGSPVLPTTPAPTPGSDTTGPATAPPQTPTTQPPPGPGSSYRAPRRAPAFSLVHVQESEIRVGVPLPEVRPVYSGIERRLNGGKQETEVRLPLVSVSF